ncbi:MAG: hypothetical protein RCO49_04165 [Rickettsia endosymbiont of Argas persicus]
MIIIPILSLFGFSCFFSKRFEIKLNYAIPITISILVTILYCFAILKLLTTVAYLLYFIGILLAFINWRRFSYESFAFTLLILAFFLYTREASLHAYDDFSHWGVFSKELLYLGFFEDQTSLSSIISTHAHYPRGAAVYHYFILMLSGYSDGNALFAHFLLHLMFLAPLASNKKMWQTGLLFSLMLCAVVLYTTGLRSIYNDSTVGLMFGAIFAIYIIEEDKAKALKLIIPITILLALFREIGVWLASFASIILILHYTIFEKKPKTSNYITYIILLALPILCNLIWMSYFKNTHNFIDRKEHSFNNLIYIAENFNEQYKLLLLNYGKFFLKFLLKEGSLVIYTLCFIAWYGVRKYKPELLKEYKFFLLATFICGIIFALWRLYLYFHAFSYEEVIRAASLLRYLGCYALGIGMLAAAYIKNSIFLSEKQNRKELFVFMMLFAISSFSVVKNILRIKHLSLEQKNFIEKTTIIRKLLEQGDKVEFNFSNKKDNLQCYILNYNLAPYLNKKYLQECLKTPNKAIIDMKGTNIYTPFKK